MLLMFFLITTFLKNSFVLIAMSYELIITEKPSAAMKIAYALSDSKPVRKMEKGVAYYLLSHDKHDIAIVPAVGHLYTVTEKKEDNSQYPSFNLKWEAVYKVNDKSAYTKKYHDAISALSKDAKSFTVACDYDIEGEVIGWNCIRFICKQKDANRMKFSTLTKSDITSAYNNKSKTLNWGQANAGETRHFLDWIYGINLSRALTLSVIKKGMKKTLSTGRVQGPTLKLVVDKEKEIAAFKPTPYWQLELKGAIKEEELTAWHEADRFTDEKEVDAISKRTKGKNGVVESIGEEEKIIYPPHAFDLTTLQTEAYYKLGISLKQTLALAQTLYLAGYISYPRTSSQKLPPTIGYSKIITAIKANEDYAKICEEILEKGKIFPRQGGKEDPAHPAIYPTGHTPKKLNKDTENIYDLIVRRFLSAFGEQAKRLATTIKIDVENEIFIAKGEVTTFKGWFEYYGKYAKFKEDKLPESKKGTNVDVNSIEKYEKETQPPRRYSQATLLRTLEEKGLGTKSTRANILDTLYKRDFVKGTWLEATTMGTKITDILVKYSPEIVDEALTKEIEEDMQLIREDKRTGKDILDKVEKVLEPVLENFKKHESEVGAELVKAQKETETEESLGKCPKCKEGKILPKRGRFGRFAACDKYPKCKSTYHLPSTGFIEAARETCKKCKFPMIFIKLKKRPKQEFCLNPECPSKKVEGVEQEKPCPNCKDGILKLRSSVYGHFYGCSNYPKCKTIEKIPKKDSDKKKTKTKDVKKK